VPDKVARNDSLPSRRNKENRRSVDLDPQAREDLFHALLEHLNEGVANVSCAGTILYANSRFVRLMDSDHAKPVVGRNLRDLISPASWDDLHRALTRGAKEPVRGEMKVEMASAGPRVLCLSFSPLCVEEETTISVAATEVTELIEKRRALEDSEASLHSLSARILQLQDEERRRIARDLHDITGQELAVVVMSLSRVAKDLDRPGPDVRQAVVDAVELVRKVEDEVRTLSYLLHPPLLDEFGLGSALGWYVEGFGKRSGIEVELYSPTDFPRLSVEKETALFRVVQESLTNVLRHSGSRKAWIRLSFDSARVHLSVEDEGCGMDGKTGAVAEAAASTGLGILGMRERLHQLGGALEIHPRLRGTQVVAGIPIEEGGRAAATSEIPFAPPASRGGANSCGNGKATRAVSRKRILIADDHEVTRRRIKTLLQDEPDLEICGEARGGLEAVTKTKELEPDLVIMDLAMPLAGGFSAANSIRNSGASAKILFFTTHTLGELERMSRKAGFEGFVCKTNAAHDLLRGVRAVLVGNEFYNSEVIQARSA
jgi:two-component system, NarL family, sensor kinase